MKVIPKQSDFSKWARLVPLDGDLVFLNGHDRELFSKIPVPMLTEVEARNQGLWTLSARSWYGYSLNKATHCAWLPKGMIECLEPKIQKVLADTQIQIGVPTLISSKILPKKISKKFLKIGRHCWITSYIWSYLSKADQTTLMQAWFIQNEIHIYSSLSLSELSPTARSWLRSIGFEKLLNRYVGISGPNCLAAVAGAAASTMHQEVSRQWLHSEPFENYLQARSYKKVTDLPQAGDLLVFRKKDQITHASFYLGDGLYFEKSGQDFYEPYRIERLTNWQKEWPGAELAIFRKI